MLVTTARTAKFIYGRFLQLLVARIYFYKCLFFVYCIPTIKGALVGALFSFCFFFVCCGAIVKSFILPQTVLLNPEEGLHMETLLQPRIT